VRKKAIKEEQPEKRRTKMPKAENKKKIKNSRGGLKLATRALRSRPFLAIAEFAKLEHVGHPYSELRDSYHICIIRIERYIFLSKSSSTLAAVEQQRVFCTKPS
jgi:hypothetical protein